MKTGIVILPINEYNALIEFKRRKQEEEDDEIRKTIKEGKTFIMESGDWNYKYKSCSSNEVVKDIASVNEKLVNEIKTLKTMSFWEWRIWRKEKSYKSLY